ncbi:MAG TPA: hypothetical protein VFE07_13505 [Marmoricola sp.]|jgi:hypothetical protein|nr:hypothetical protein [Marmoricola sp.]
MNDPALLSLHAPLDAVRAALIGLGAIIQDRRSVALDLGEDLLVLDYDRAEHVTTVAVGGPDPTASASWLAAQLEEHGFPLVGMIPPPLASAT